MVLRAVFMLLLFTLCLVGCSMPTRVGEELPRKGDEIVVAGRYFHTGAPVVLWTDPGGYDAYRVERRFVPIDEAGWDKTKDTMKAPNRFDARSTGMSPEQIEATRGGGWELDQLREVVDQFVLHYDVCGTSRTCFRVLHDMRRLSVHFMVDIDGTIYQTLDVKERAWHATTSNTRSVGVEIANIGAYPPGGKNPFNLWYAKDEFGNTWITIPPEKGDGGVRTKGFIGRPMANDPIVGAIQGETLEMYDFTPEQYDSLSRLIAALHKTLPKIQIDFPRDSEGNLVRTQLQPETLQQYQGVLAHYHVQNNKTDPGPAMRWEMLIERSRALSKGKSVPALQAEPMRTTFSQQPTTPATSGRDTNVE